jgi:hypothetical protein
MTAYLGTGAVRTFIVPGTPPADMAVATNFERFDGLDEPPLEHATGLVPEGAAYGHTPRPGQLNTPPPEQVYTPGPISGLVGVLGGQPWPVGNRRPPAANAEGQTTQAPQRIIGGPKLVLPSQHNPGLAATVFMAEITSSPPQPGDMTSILAGLA